MPAQPGAPLGVAASQSPFSAVEAQYQWMRGEMAAGRMSLQQCYAMLAAMTLRDAYGRAWMLNVNDGQWLVYNGHEWVRGDPHQLG